MSDMMNKTVLFLVANGLDGSAFVKLWQCFGDLNASTRLAGAIADEEIRSIDGRINTHTDMSFADATGQNFDVVVIADGITANAMKGDLAANTLISNTFENNAAVVAVDDGVLALIGANIVSGLEVAAPDSLQDQLGQAGGRRASEPICVSNNLFTATGNADMQSLCNSVSDYITSLGGAMAA